MFYRNMRQIEFQNYVATVGAFKFYERMCVAFLLAKIVLVTH